VAFRLPAQRNDAFSRLESVLPPQTQPNVAARTVHPRAEIAPLAAVPEAALRVRHFVAQAGWTDPGLRFWRYRDKDQVEVDLVITRGRQTRGIEVKSAVTATPADGAGLRRLAEQCGTDYRGGVVLYAGDSAFPLSGGRDLAVPLARLWSM